MQLIVNYDKENVPALKKVEILTSGKSKIAKSPVGRGRKSVQVSLFEAQSAEKGRLKMVVILRKIKFAYLKT